MTDPHERYIYVVAHLNTPDEAVYRVADGERLRIGRKPADQGCEGGVLRLVLPFPEVSGFHAEISVEGDGWFVADLDSMNGTSVNGQVCGGKSLKMPFGTYEIGIAQYRLRVFAPGTYSLPPWESEAFDEKADQFKVHLGINATPTPKSTCEVLPTLDEVLNRAPVYSTDAPNEEETPRIDVTMHGPTVEETEDA